jgi:hypothetical protein
VTVFQNYAFFIVQLEDWKWVAIFTCISAWRADGAVTLWGTALTLNRFCVMSHDSCVMMPRSDKRADLMTGTSLPWLCAA